MIEGDCPGQHDRAGMVRISAHGIASFRLGAERLGPCGSRGPTGDRGGVDYQPRVRLVVQVGVAERLRQAAARERSRRVGVGWPAERVVATPRRGPVSSPAR